MSESWVNDENALGHLVQYGVSYALCPNEYTAGSAMKCLRHMWPKIEPYFQRRIIVEIEVALLRQDRNPIAMSDEWQKLRDELRGPKSPFTADYRCGKCKREGLKLWRGVHGRADKDGNELLCAACLAPGEVINEEGRSYRDASVGGRTDQVRGWLPAIPVDDTYWGYSSVPSQDVDWWRTLPTYAEPRSASPSAEESKKP